MRHGFKKAVAPAADRAPLGLAATRVVFDAAARCRARGGRLLTGRALEVARAAIFSKARIVVRELRRRDARAARRK